MVVLNSDHICFLFVWQCGIQCVICVPCDVCIFWQGQCCSQGPRQVSVGVAHSVGSTTYMTDVITKWCIDHFVPNRFFKESSEEEREHAEKLMEYQVKTNLNNQDNPNFMCF